MISWKDNCFFFLPLCSVQRSEFISPRHWLTCAEVHHHTFDCVSTSFFFIPSMNVSSCERIKPPFCLFISIFIHLSIYLFLVLSSALFVNCVMVFYAQIWIITVMLSRGTTHLSMLILNYLEKWKRHRHV